MILSVGIAAIAIAIVAPGAQLPYAIDVPCEELSFEISVLGEGPECARWSNGEAAIERALHRYTDDAFLLAERAVPPEPAPERLRGLSEAMFHTTADWSEPAEASGYVVQDFAGWRASPDGLTSEERDLFSFRCFGFTRTDRLVRWAGLYCTFGGGPPLHPVLKAKILERIVDRAPG